MNIIQKIQNKPTAEKMRIIWTIVAIAAILLIGLWIVSARYKKSVPKDTTLFKTIDTGIKDVQENYNKSKQQ